MLRFVVVTVLVLLLPRALLANGIDVLDYARAPAFSFATLAPSGTRVSYVDQHGREQVVFVRALGGQGAQPTLRTELPDERIRWCGWADDRYLVCGTTVIVRKEHRLQERTKLYSINAVSGRVLELNTRLDSVPRDHVIDLMPTRERQVLLQRDVDARGFPEVVALDVATGETRSVIRAQPPIRSWMSDGQGEVRLGLAYDEGMASLFVRVRDEWVRALEQSLSDPEAIGPLAFGATASDLYVLKHRGGRAALFRVNPTQPGSETLLFAEPMFDVSGPVELHPSTRELLAVRYDRESPAVHVFSDEEREARAWLDGALPEVVNAVVGRSLDNKRWLVESASDTNPPSLYVVDLRERTLELLGHQFPELEVQRLAPTRALMYRARDGQRIPAYLTRPLDATGPGPAVVLPHGGPETRDVRKFDPLVQLLAARGFSVLQMNYRGSLGYGAGFAAAGARQWGGVIHNDITDGARWLIEQRIAVPDRICIVGSSFGGYAALLGAARESQWYACAASFGGASDLLAYSEFTRRLPDAHTWQERLGSDSRALWQMSPLALAWRFETPVLLLHGRRDAVVPPSQSRRLAKALRDANKPHHLIELTECDHAMTARSCRNAVFAELDAFLRETLSP